MTSTTRVVLIVSVFFASTALAQSAHPLRFDDRIRITYVSDGPSGLFDQEPAVAQIGWLARVDDRVVTLVGDLGRPIAVPRSRIATIERLSGTGRWSRDETRRFAAIAGGIGAVIVRNATRDGCSIGPSVLVPPFSCVYYTLDDRSFVTAAVGGLAGALAGHFVIPSSRWTAVPLTALDELAQNE